MSLVIRDRTVIATTPARCANSKAPTIPNRRSTALRPTSRMLPEPEWFHTESAESTAETV